MADTTVAAEAAPKKRKKLPILIALVLAIALGGGGFYATYTGLVLGSPAGEGAAEDAADPLPDISFIPLQPVVISLGAAAQNQHLKMTAQVEVTKNYADEVTLLTPRILDVLNSYLRAVEVRDLEDPAALMRLRAQMLRRIQMVTGDGRVRDLLITEFILN